MARHAVFWNFCRGCGTKHMGTPMLKNDVWAEASSKYPMCVMAAFIDPAKTRRVKPYDFLCIRCVEKALGRQIVIEDLHEVPMNYFVRRIHRRMVNGTYEGSPYPGRPKKRG